MLMEAWLQFDRELHLTEFGHGHSGRRVSVAEAVGEEAGTRSVVAQRLRFDAVDVEPRLVRRRLDVQVESSSSSFCSRVSLCGEEKDQTKAETEYRTRELDCRRVCGLALS